MAFRKPILREPDEFLEYLLGSCQIDALRERSVAKLGPETGHRLTRSLASHGATELVGLTGAEARQRHGYAEDLLLPRNPDGGGHDPHVMATAGWIVRMDPDQWLKTIYAAMKPGAVAGIIDHVALPNGDTRGTVAKLHRIDPEIIKADFQRAGFELIGVRNFLRNPADDHSLIVFDPKVRGNTDRVVYRFRKPR